MLLKSRAVMVACFLGCCLLVAPFGQSEAKKVKRAKKPVVKAAITEQSTKLVKGDKVNIQVEITSLVALPYYLQFKSYTGISGFKTLSAGENKRARSVKGKALKQRFRILLRATTACRLSGAASSIRYVFRCTRRKKGCTYQSKRVEKITFKLNSENFCAGKTVNVKKK